MNKLFSIFVLSKSVWFASMLLLVITGGCALNDSVEPVVGVKKPQKITKKDKNRNSVDHKKKNNILMTSLAMNIDKEQELGINKKSKLQSKCIAKAQCAMLIQHKIINLWEFPKSYPKFKTILVIELTEQGYITTIRLKRSSGKRAFDDSVLKAVRHAAPFSEITYLSAVDIAEFSSIEMVFKR